MYGLLPLFVKCCAINFSIFVVTLHLLPTGQASSLGIGMPPGDCPGIVIPEGSDWITESVTPYESEFSVSNCSRAYLTSFYCFPMEGCSLIFPLVGTCGSQAGFYECPYCTDGTQCIPSEMNSLKVLTYLPGEALQRVEEVGFLVSTIDVGIPAFNISQCLSRLCWSLMAQGWVGLGDYFISFYPSSRGSLKRSIQEVCSVNYFNNSITCPNGTYFAVDLLSVPINVTGSNFHVTDYFVFCDSIHCFSPFHISVVPTSSSSMPLWAFITSWVVSFILFLVVAFCLCRVLPSLLMTSRM